MFGGKGSGLRLSSVTQLMMFLSWGSPGEGGQAHFIGSLLYGGVSWTERGLSLPILPGKALVMETVNDPEMVRLDSLSLKLKTHSPSIRTFFSLFDMYSQLFFFLKKGFQNCLWCLQLPFLMSLEEVVFILLWT